MPDTLTQIRLILRGFSDSAEEAYAAARNIIHQIAVTNNSPDLTAEDKDLFALSCALSVTSLPGYATLDLDHIHEIQKIITEIKKYVDDLSQKRPLNFLMLASPGAGKSHFINCIASNLRSDVSSVTFNMAGLQANEDLIPSLDAVRNLKMQERRPLLFLDEFDTSPDNYALLLPLLWDGEITLGQRELKLAKIVIVLAGSRADLPKTMERARSMTHKTYRGKEPSTKLPDLLSRINGGIFEIPAFFDSTHNLDRRVDKVCIAVQLLRRRFGQTLKTVPLALLRFIAQADFRYSVRSITHLIDLIPYEKDLVDLAVNKLDLPLDIVDKLRTSSLAYHLRHKRRGAGMVDTWRQANTTSLNVPVQTKLTKYVADVPPVYIPNMSDDFLISLLTT